MHTKLQNSNIHLKSTVKMTSRIPRKHDHRRKFGNRMCTDGDQCRRSQNKYH